MDDEIETFIIYINTEICRSRLSTHAVLYRFVAWAIESEILLRSN